MKQKNFIVECLQGAEFEQFIIRDPRTGAVLEVARTPDDIATFFSSVFVENTDK